MPNRYSDIFESKIITMKLPMQYTFESIHLQVSADSNKYIEKQMLAGSDIESDRCSLEKFMNVLNGMMDFGYSILREKKYMTFRIHVVCKNTSFHIYPAKSEFQNFVTKTTLLPKQMIIEQHAKFIKLTKRETQLLSLLYTGHKQNVSEMMGITVATFRRHRTNLYGKMGFRNRVDLVSWVERNLEHVLPLGVRKFS